MPIPSRYHRSPLLKLTYTPFNDDAVKITDPLLFTLTDRALKLVPAAGASVPECALATILGGYETPPEQPDLDGVSPLENPVRYARSLAAAETIAMLSRSLEEVDYVRDKLAVWQSAMADLSEEDVFFTGGIMLPMLADYYCRTGDRRALSIAEAYRAQLPNVGAFLSAFPFEAPYDPNEKAAMEEDTRLRMDRFASHPALALQECVQLARFTGSRTTFDAVTKGFASLVKFHGQPNGALSQEPFLAGRNAARSADFVGCCEWVVALSDALLLTGDARFADRLNLMIENVLPELVAEGGIRRSLAPTQEQAAPLVAPDENERYALLTALLAIRRCLCVRAEDDTVDTLLCRGGEYRFALNGENIRIVCTAEGFFKQQFRVRTECKNPIHLTLRIRVPFCSGGAKLLLNGQSPQLCPVNQVARVSRKVNPGDEITLEAVHTPRVERGYRNAYCVYAGDTLMALPLPAPGSEYRYALVEGSEPEESSFEERPAAAAHAVFAPDWGRRNGEIMPPPQGLRASGEQMELLLLPEREAPGRVAELPAARLLPGEAWNR